MINRVLTEPGPLKGSSTPAQTAISDTASIVLGANASRKSFTIQNTGTTILKFVLGTSVPTQTVYHVVLKAAGVADNGTGGEWTEQGWVGTVYGISSAAGGTCVILERTVASPDWDSSMKWGSYNG